MTSAAPTPGRAHLTERVVGRSSRLPGPESAREAAARIVTRRPKPGTSRSCASWSASSPAEAARDAEDLAVESVLRVAAKCGDVDASGYQDRIGYFYGVAPQRPPRMAARLAARVDETRRAGTGARTPVDLGPAVVEQQGSRAALPRSVHDEADPPGQAADPELLPRGRSGEDRVSPKARRRVPASPSTRSESRSTGSGTRCASASSGACTPRPPLVPGTDEGAKRFLRFGHLGVERAEVQRGLPRVEERGDRP